MLLKVFWFGWLSMPNLMPASGPSVADALKIQVRAGPLNPLHDKGYIFNKYHDDCHIAPSAGHAIVVLMINPKAKEKK